MYVWTNRCINVSMVNGNDMEDNAMRGLAWYTGIIIVLANIYMFIEAVTTTSIDVFSSNVWGFVLNIPILLFAIMYLVRNK